MTFDIRFSHLVKDRRTAIGLTQAELANRVGCAPITIRKIEADTLRPSFQMAERLALALNIPEAEQLMFVRLSRQKKHSTPIPKPTPSPSEIGLSNLSGRAVKGFQLGELIGSGGFGVVYKAIQPSVNREVAVKIILPKFANQPEFIRRFESEAQLVARLEHPHIVPLYDYWREPDAAYLIMRMLKGGSLEQRIQQGGSSLADSFHIMQQVGLALDAAHRNGVIHRDIKPANVMLDEFGNAYLTDFGIAKNLEDASSQLSQGGAIIGSPAYISPEQILSEPVRRQSDIYCFGIMLFELISGKKPFSGPTPVAFIQQHINDQLPSLLDHVPDAPRQLDQLIQKATKKKPEDRYQTILELLIDLEHIANAGKQMGILPASSQRIPLSTQEISALENPFLGLRPFTEAHANNFYGRNALIQEILGLMADETDLTRFVAVVGPSGSGKSSAVKAGLIPALRRGGLPASENWFITHLNPSRYPWEELEAALLRIAADPPDNLAQQLMVNERGLLRTVNRLLPDDDQTELVLVIDQFEELFTLVEDEQTRSLFLDSLVTAVLDPRSRIRLVLTLRADFTDRPLQYADFGELMRLRMVFVLPLIAQELIDAITQPVIRLGLEMEPVLVTTIVQDVGDQPGMLPLLQYTLTELFERRNSRLLTLSDYQAAGGVTGALARRADEIFARLDTAGQEDTRQLFLRLVTLGEGVEDTRRRVLLSELMSLSNKSPFVNHQSPIINEYGRYRLLTFDHDTVTRGATVEVAHEALLREWPRLRGWLTESREDVRQQRELALVSAQWEVAKQDASYLLRGSRLTQFEAWFETTAVALTTNERTFLDQSISARDQRQAEEAARQQRELESAQKLAEEQTHRAEEQSQAAHSLRQRALFLSGALVLAAILAVAAFGFARSSTNNANLASTRAGEALANLDLAATNEANAITNANLASIREAEAEQEREAALTAQEQAQEQANFRATAEAVAVDERQIAQQQQAIAEEQLHLATSRELALAANANLETNPERSLLLGLTALGNAYTGEAEEVVRAALQASRVELTLTEEGEDIWWIDYHPDGDWLAGVGEGRIVIWDTNNGDRLQTISLAVIDNPSQSGGLDISPDGSLLAVTSQNQILILDTNSWEIIHTLVGHTDIVHRIAFNPDSNLLASGSQDGELKIWDLISGENQLTVLASDEGYANDVAFSRDGSRIATGGDDLTARVWDVTTGEELIRIVHDPTALWVNHVEFNADGTRLFTIPAGNDTFVVTVWDIETNRSSELTEPLAEWSISQNNLITKLALSPNGRYLAIASLDSTVKLLDVTNLNGEEVLTLSGHKDSVGDIAFAPDGGRMATVSGGEVRIWDISEAGPGEVLNIADDSFPVALHSETNSLVTFTIGGTVHIWDATTGELLHTFDTQLQSRRFSMDVSPDGRYLARGSNNNILGVWDLTTQQEVYTRTAHGPGIVGGIFPGIIDLAFSPDSTQFATAGADGFVKVWDVASGEIISECIADSRISKWSEEGLPTGVTHVEFSPDGRYLAAASDPPEDGTARIKIWDLSNNSELTVIENIQTRVWSFAISPDSRLIASTVGNGVKLWEITTGIEVAFIEETLNGVDYFSADGRQLIGTGDNLIIYDLETEETQLSFPEGGGSILSSDGQQLVIRNNGIISIHTLDFAKLIEIARSRVSRRLTEAECKEYLHLDICPEN